MLVFLANCVLSIFGRRKRPRCRGKALRIFSRRKRPRMIMLYYVHALDKYGLHVSPLFR